MRWLLLRNPEQGGCELPREAVLLPASRKAGRRAQLGGWDGWGSAPGGEVGSAGGGAGGAEAAQTSPRPAPPGKAEETDESRQPNG